jgi:hypothetical protein
LLGDFAFVKAQRGLGARWCCDSDRGELSVALKPQHDEDYTSSSFGFTIEEGIALMDALYCIVKEEVKGNRKARLSLGEQRSGGLT